jgi:hypothetical protein
MKLLIDCGNEDSARELVKPFLCAQGVNRLAGLCLAVGRLEYFGGARLILSNFPLPKFPAARRKTARRPFATLLGDLRQTNGWRAVKTATPSRAGPCCIPAHRINSRKPTTTRWSCAASSTAIPFCSCRLWGATARKRSCDGTRICARKLSSPVCRRATNRCANRCWTSCARSHRYRRRRLSRHPPRPGQTAPEAGPPQRARGVWPRQRRADIGTYSGRLVPAHRRRPAAVNPPPAESRETP